MSTQMMVNNPNTGLYMGNKNHFYHFTLPSFTSGKKYFLLPKLLWKITRDLTSKIRFCLDQVSPQLILTIFIISFLSLITKSEGVEHHLDHLCAVVS
jgi:hypothetical protein